MREATFVKSIATSQQNKRTCSVDSKICTFNADLPASAPVEYRSYSRNDRRHSSCLVQNHLLFNVQHLYHQSAQPILVCFNRKTYDIFGPAHRKRSYLPFHIMPNSFNISLFWSKEIHPATRIRNACPIFLNRIAISLPQAPNLWTNTQLLRAGQTLIKSERARTMKLSGT